MERDGNTQVGTANREAQRRQIHVLCTCRLHLKDPIHATPEEFENSALFRQLGLPSTLICHENGDFRKLFSNQSNLRKPGFVFLWTKNIVKTQLFENDDAIFTEICFRPKQFYFVFHQLYTADFVKQDFAIYECLQTQDVFSQSFSCLQKVVRRSGAAKHSDYPTLGTLRRLQVCP